MDKIVYLLVSEPGGCDGMDHKAKGGKIIKASFNSDYIKKAKGVDSRYRIEKEIIDTEEVTKKAMSKLSTIEKLLIGPIQKRGIR